MPHDEALGYAMMWGSSRRCGRLGEVGGPSEIDPRRSLTRPSGRSFRGPFRSDEVIDIFAAAGLKKPDISILSDEFLAEVQHLPQRTWRWNCCGSC